ncbi:Tfp pilus assembly protein PilW [Psychrobacter phenylpyruvicus]|uniref:Tfp pilus assembly protein PilW n=2 Tax=Psychrobacter phenylpyruvicus TaxID=29432 RepID=A0A379LHA1_9GAMM|nr:Tfp pilus assembly protein PilW [Psychrobacter phenylpyruvicus]
MLHKVNHRQRPVKALAKMRCQSKANMTLTERGFTLIELMLALSLGLVISSAAFQLFTHSMSTQKLQRSVSEVQDAAVFGLTAMVKEISHANLGASNSMRQQTAGTGIVLTGSEDSLQSSLAGKPIKVGNLRGIRGIEPRLLTKNGAGPSNLIAPATSDQLTIQYQAPFDSYDCEGRTVNKGDMVIERYFTRIDNQRVGKEDKAQAIVLACDAGSYLLNGVQNANSQAKDSLSIEGFGDNGVILINRVDYFSVKLGVQLEQGVAYMPIDTYLTKHASSQILMPYASNYIYDAPIVAIELGVIARSMSEVAGGDSKKMRTTFQLQGEDYQIRQTTPHYKRQTLQTVVALRNTRLSQ